MADSPTLGTCATAWSPRRDRPHERNNQCIGWRPVGDPTVEPATHPRPTDTPPDAHLPSDQSDAPLARCGRVVTTDPRLDGLENLLVPGVGSRLAAEPAGAPSPVTDDEAPSGAVPVPSVDREAEFRNVGRFAAHGHDGRGWLGNTDVFVRAEDYDNHVNYTDDGFRIYAENARLAADLVEAIRQRDEAVELLRDHECYEDGSLVGGRIYASCSICAFLAGVSTE